MFAVFKSWWPWLAATVLLTTVTVYVMPREPVEGSCPGCDCLGPFQDAMGLYIAPEGRCAYDFQGKKCPRCGVVFKKFGPSSYQFGIEFAGYVDAQP